MVLIFSHIWFVDVFASSTDDPDGPRQHNQHEDCSLCPGRQADEERRRRLVANFLITKCKLRNPALNHTEPILQMLHKLRDTAYIQAVLRGGSFTSTPSSDCNDRVCLRGYLNALTRHIHAAPTPSANEPITTQWLRFICCAKILSKIKASSEYRSYQRSPESDNSMSTYLVENGLTFQSFVTELELVRKPRANLHLVYPIYNALAFNQICVPGS